MLEKFQEFIALESLCTSDTPLLLAVSGGVDSVVLCHLCHRAGLKFGIAHCNFKLREAASDGDEIFVKVLAQHFDVPYYTTAFDTEKIANQKKLSIQETARNLRYEWLEKIRQQHHYTYLATAHHANDAIETALYNLTKGTGIRGLHGILAKKESLIRPLLFASKKEIIAYAQKHMINYREDASNASDKYSRNFIRHQVVPQLEQINPNFINTSKATLRHLRDTELLFDYAIKGIQKAICKQDDFYFYINIKQLLEVPAPATVLYEILKAYNFNSDQVQQLLEVAQKGESGKQFLSKSHHLVVDRLFFIIKRQVENSLPKEILITKENSQVNLGSQVLHLKYLEKVPTSFPNTNAIAYLDAAQLHFPLKLRRWQTGDNFQPLGMKGKHQKVQDFFSNQKFHLFQKEAAWILESQNIVCWIVGHRLDERFKLSASTKSVYQLALKSIEKNTIS